MAAPCDTYFDLYSLDHSSMETEVGWSTLCVPNTTKLALFVIMLVWPLLTALTCLYLMVAEWRETGRGWTRRRQIYFFLLWGGVAGAILMVLFILGVHNRGHYFLIPFANLSINSSAWILIEIFIRAFADSIHNVQVDQRLVKLKRVNAIFSVLAGGLAFLFFGILPIIFAEQPLVLNALYTTAVVINMLTATFFCVLFAIIAHRLISLLHPSPEIPLAADLVVVKKKLINLRLIGVAFAASSIPGWFFPLWIILTAKDGDPGMQGIFYFHFVYLLTWHNSGSSSILFAALKAKGKGGTSPMSSQHDRSGKERTHSESSHPEKSNSLQFAFTIEELNGKE